MYILSIDQGTTGTTTALVNKRGKIIASSNIEFKQIYPEPGWVEHNPEDIWKSVKKSVKKTLDLSKVDPKKIKAIGITNQRETTVMWDKDNGEIVHNAIVWQCKRTTQFCESLKKKGLEKIIFKKTGLLVDPYFSGSKMRWLTKFAKSKKIPIADLLTGTIDTYLLWRLTKGASFKTDVSNASRTQLMNLKTLDWDDELLKIFGVPKSILPEIADTNSNFGETKGLSFLPDGIPIMSMIGDQQSALFGQAAFSAGQSKCTFGTGSFILLNTGEDLVFSKHKLLTTVAWKLSGEKAKYALEGGAFICGAAVQWLRDGLGLIKESSEIEKLAKAVKTTDGVQFVPSLSGLSAPYWDPNSRGSFLGITRGTKKEHLALATLEAMALQNVDILNSMEKDLGKKIKSLKVDGGAVSNNTLMQLQSDYLGVKIAKPKQTETTVLGAAYLAGLGIGLWKSQKELESLIGIDREFKPAIKKKEREARLAEWSRAVYATMEYSNPT